jgi:hypothetical protein
MRHPGARTTRRLTTVDEVRIAPNGEAFSGAPHACNDGWVTIGQMVLDEDTGEEVEEYALYLCRRCSEGRRQLRNVPQFQGGEA